MTKLTSLTKAEENKVVEIKRIKAGHKAHTFLADLGIHEGEKIRVIKNDVGPVVVEVKRTKIALGRGLASKIEIL
ncbi:MAG: FeoA family protein [Candidatus Heimdallarchaeaceae archaeon]